MRSKLEAWSQINRFLNIWHFNTPSFLNCLSMVDKAAVGNNTVGKSVVDSVDRGSVDKRSGVDGVGKNRGVDSVGNVDRGSGNVATSRGRGVDSLTRVGDLSNVAGQVV